MTEHASGKLVGVTEALEGFTRWLEDYGESSWDHQSYYASPLGRKAKALYYNSPLLGKLAVMPMVLSEAFLPSTRRLFWQKERLPISDAHYAMGFAYLYQVTENENFYQRAVHFLEVLKETRCRDYEHYCWGYPFDWQTRVGMIRAGTPLITTTPYVYEAFSCLHDIDGREEWLDVMRSIAQHVYSDIKDYPAGPGAATCSYTPFDKGGVVNASAYRAFLLFDASLRFSIQVYEQAAAGNLNFVLQNQKENGCWYYSVDGVRDFVDHFHTCFVLKALAKIQTSHPQARCEQALDRGVEYYVDNVFDDAGLPRPFSRAPRMTVYKREAYDLAECVNLGALLLGRFQKLDRFVGFTVADIKDRWIKPDGSFRSRELFLGWDNVPMHRWAQSQLFRSLAFYLLRVGSLGHQDRQET